MSETLLSDWGWGVVMGVLEERKIVLQYLHRVSWIPREEGEGGGGLLFGFCVVFELEHVNLERLFVLAHLA